MVSLSLKEGNYVYNECFPYLGSPGVPATAADTEPLGLSPVSTGLTRGAANTPLSHTLVIPESGRSLTSPLPT